MMKKQPLVSIVGAGPGDPDLITVKGMNAIKSADVILYDALVNPRLLDVAPRRATKIFVGKRCGRHSMKQSDINLLIVQHALRKGHVVRLKGGDPFVFGRGYEELDYIRSFDIQVSVIPGVTSATSLSTLKGVPLTSRGYSESFWVLTGTTRSHQLSEDIRLACRSSATLVFLMATRKIDLIMDLLIKNGRRALPVMIIQNGSRKDEKVLIATAEEMKYKKKEMLEGAPGIVVAGEVVALHPEFIYEKSLRTWL